MLLDGAIGNPRRDAHSVPAVAGVEGVPQLLAVAIAEFRPPELLARRPRSLEAGFRALADLFTLELCKRGQGWLGGCCGRARFQSTGALP